MSQSDDVLIRKQGRAGRITLNRPAQLNALTWDMALAMEKALDAWVSDADVAVVVVDGAGEKAFCAGGDISELYKRAQAKDYAYGQTFWRDEYRLNAKIHRYPKPYVAFMDGIVMGGGVGVSAHGSHRIVTERSIVAMPEAGIGLIPDVGGTFLLSRAPGRCGEYLAMTSARMGPGDAIYAGFADLFVPSARKGEAIAAVCETGEASAADRLAEPAPESALKVHAAKIDALFAGANALACLNALEASATEFASAAAAAIRRNSPLSVATACEAVRRSRQLPTLEECLGLEYRFTYRSQEMSDFLEGIRAAVIDKDRNPRWRTGRLEEVHPSQVAALLAPLGDYELGLETPEGACE